MKVSGLILKEAEERSAKGKPDYYRYYRWAWQSEFTPRIKALLDLARSMQDIPIEEGRLDNDPLLLGVKNGVVDLSTGCLRGARRTDLITKQADCHFDPHATCSIFLRFIEDITGGDRDLAEFLQRVMGYCLTGETSEQCMFILLGSGANGKSIFLDVLQSLVGDYAKTTSPETLMTRSNSGGATPELADLSGARVVTASEPKDGAVLNEALVKSLTGEDMIMCRPLYSQPVQYRPQFKIFLATNFEPEIAGTGHAIWRRIHLIPFNVTIPAERQDKQLAKKLKRELPGILNWALDGLKLYRANGLKPPDCVAQATRAYRSHMDVVGDWIKERCEVNPAATTPAAELYGDYRGWCISSHHIPISSRKFGRELQTHNFKPARSAVKRLYQGIRLKGP